MARFVNMLLVLKIFLSSIAVFAGNQDFIQSSVLWNKEAGTVYFPGLKAVYHNSGYDQEFRIEFYLSRKINVDQINLVIDGPFGKSTNFIEAEPTVCDDQPHQIGNAEQLAFQCYVDFTVKTNVPSGLVSLQVEIEESGGTLRHPNLYFVMVLPEQALLTSDRSLSEASDTFISHRKMGDLHQESVVQISLPGNMSIGTGFFVENPYELEEFLEGVSIDDRGLYVLSAAHVFP